MQRLGEALGDRLGYRVLPDGLDTSSTIGDVLHHVAGPRIATVEAAPRGIEAASVTPPSPWLLGGAELEWNLAPPELVEEWRRHEGDDNDGDRLWLIPMREHGHVNSSHLVASEHPVARIAVEDAAAHGVADGDLVELASATGALQATVNVDGRLRPGVVALPHGHIELPVNDLTSPRSTNPATGMPAYAAVPVRLIKRGAGHDG